MIQQYRASILARQISSMLPSSPPQPLHNYPIAFANRFFSSSFSVSAVYVQLPCNLNLFRFSNCDCFRLVFFALFVAHNEHVIHQFNLVWWKESTYLVGLLRRRKCALFRIMSEKNAITIWLHYVAFVCFYVLRLRQVNLCNIAFG